MSIEENRPHFTGLFSATDRVGYQLDAYRKHAIIVGDISAEASKNGGNSEVSSPLWFYVMHRRGSMVWCYPLKCGRHDFFQKECFLH